MDIIYGSYAEIIPMPSAELMGRIGAVSLEQYLATADGIGQLCDGLMPRGRVRVLDLGCGCGRLARHFVPQPRVTRYVGIDVMKHEIDWCRQEIGSRHGKAEFHFVDLRSATYNPGGQLLTKDYRFPCADSTVDFVCAISVFTHLLEVDARHFLHETRRVLSGKGCALYSIHYDRATQAAPFVGNEDRIDIELSYWMGMAAEAGLEVCGPWPAGKDIYGQRHFVLRRKQFRWPWTSRVSQAWCNKNKGQQ